jgi:hypothetical protein
MYAAVYNKIVRAVMLIILNNNNNNNKKKTRSGRNKVINQNKIRYYLNLLQSNGVNISIP